MLSRGRRRTLSFGLQTVTGLRQRGYFIPMRNAPASAAWASRPYPALAARFASAEPWFHEHLAAIERHSGALAAIKGPPPQPRFDQTWFPRLDAAALYTLVRDTAPARVVEVGSGHSTRFAMRAIADGGHGTRVTAIDPAPRADLAGLPLKLVRETVQDAGLGAFEQLDAGDMLLVDSSHVLMPGTDVDIVLNQVIPALPSGVIVTFHDIFLPSPYPPVWPFTIYNEQNAIAPLLLTADLLFASAYVVAAMPQALAQTFIGAQPLKAGARESFLALRL